MSTEKRAAQAKINGALSSGPKLEAGKAKCAEAAKKRHRSAAATFLGEGPNAFEAAHCALYLHLRPAGPIEIKLIDELVVIILTIPIKQVSQNAGFCPAHDGVARRGTSGTAKAEAVANTEMKRGALSLKRSRSLLLRDLAGLKRQKKTTLRVQLPLKTRDLTSDPLDPDFIQPVDPGPCGSFRRPADLSPALRPPSPREILTWDLQNFAFGPVKTYRDLLPAQATGGAIVILLSTNGEAPSSISGPAKVSPGTVSTSPLRTVLALTGSSSPRRVCNWAKSASCQTKILSLQGVNFSCDMILNAFKDHVNQIFPWEDLAVD